MKPFGQHHQMRIIKTNQPKKPHDLHGKLPFNNIFFGKLQKAQDDGLMAFPQNWGEA